MNSAIYGNYKFGQSELKGHRTFTFVWWIFSLRLPPTQFPHFMPLPIFTLIPYVVYLLLRIQNPSLTPYVPVIHTIQTDLRSKMFLIRPENLTPNPISLVKIITQHYWVTPNIMRLHIFFFELWVGSWISIIDRLHSGSFKLRSWIQERWRRGNNTLRLPHLYWSHSCFLGIIRKGVELGPTSRSGLPSHPNKRGHFRYPVDIPATMSQTSWYVFTQYPSDLSVLSVEWVVDVFTSLIGVPCDSSSPSF